MFSELPWELSTLGIASNNNDDDRVMSEIQGMTLDMLIRVSEHRDEDWAKTAIDTITANNPLLLLIYKKICDCMDAGIVDKTEISNAIKILSASPEWQEAVGMSNIEIEKLKMGDPHDDATQALLVKSATDRHIARSN